MGKILTLNEAVKIANNLKNRGKKIVTTNGCFDILHVGHVRYLQKAKKLGDVLIVGVNSDKSTKMNKGKNRPIVPENERIEMLAALECVDYVFMFDKKIPNKWVEKIRPDFHVKACDNSYGIEQCVERFAVEKSGGKVVLVPKTEGKSTTNIIETILKKCGGEYV
jgi:rfaE bifunctional protein nucleotidyltransferase chain/domain